MRIKFLLCALSLITAGCASDEKIPDRQLIEGLDFPEAIVLKVRVDEAENTGYVPGKGCEEGQVCFFHQFWWRHTAIVVEKIRGQWKGRTVTFAKVGSGPLACYENDCFVVLRKLPFELTEKFKADYEVLDFLVHASKNDILKMRQPVSSP